MKKKIFATLLLLASIAFESSAYTILISGGGKNQRFYRIFISDKTAQRWWRSARLLLLEEINHIVGSSGE